MEQEPSYGRITVANEVLETIVRLTALAVPGVVRLVPPDSFQRLLKVQDGVQVTVRDGVVEVNLYVVIESGRNALTLCRQIQAEVTRAIADIVALEVKEVNVYVEDFVPADSGE